MPQPRILEGHRVGSCFVAGVAINQIGRKPYRPPLPLDLMVRRSAGAGCELHEPLGCLYRAMTDRMQLIRRPGRRAFGCFSFNRPPALANQATPATPPADQVRAPLGPGRGGGWRARAAAFSAALLIPRPDALQRAPELPLGHRPGQAPPTQGAADPPDLQATKDQGEQPQLDIAPIQLLHAPGLSGLPLDE